MCSGETAVSPRPRASHQPRNGPTARLYAARVRRFAIRAAKNSRNRATATGPASTISGGSSNSARGARAGRLSLLDERLEGHRDPDPPDPGEPGPPDRGDDPGARDAEEPCAIAAGAEVLVERLARLERRDGVGEGEEPAGRGGHGATPRSLEGP